MFQSRLFGGYLYNAEPCAAPSGLVQLIWKITVGLAFCITAEFQSGMNALSALQRSIAGMAGRVRPHISAKLSVNKGFQHVGFSAKLCLGLCICTGCAFAYGLLGMRPRSEVNSLSKPVQCVESGICTAADTELIVMEDFERCVLLPGKDANIN